MSNRNHTIDLLKTIAIIGVLTIHSCTGWNLYAIGSFNWLANLFFGSVSRASVPLFLMCSGVLMLNPEKELSLRKLYTKSFFRIVAAMLFWSMAYKIFHMIGGEFSFAILLQAVKDVLLFRHEGHLYYLHITILVYAFLPVTRVFVAHATKKQLEYFLAVWFFVGILYPTLSPFWPFTQLSGIPKQWLLNMSYAAIGYGVLGYYLRHFPSPKRLWYVVCGGLGFALVLGGTWFMSVRNGAYYGGFMEGMTVGVCLMAVGIFGFFSASRTEPGTNARAVIGFVSKASFCIYLVHMFWLHIFSALGFRIEIFPVIFSVPLLVLANLALSAVVYVCLSRIPVVKTLLI